MSSVIAVLINRVDAEMDKVAGPHGPPSQLLLRQISNLGFEWPKHQQDVIKNDRDRTTAMIFRLRSQ